MVCVRITATKERAKLQAENAVQYNKMFKLFDVVKLKRDDDVHGVKESFTGTIVDVQAGGKAFTVEFIDEKGETVESALFTDYRPDEIDLVR